MWSSFSVEGTGKFLVGTLQFKLFLNHFLLIPSLSLSLRTFQSPSNDMTSLVSDGDGCKVDVVELTRNRHKSRTIFITKLNARSSSSWLFIHTHVLLLTKVSCLCCCLDFDIGEVSTLFAQQFEIYFLYFYVVLIK